MKVAIITHCFAPGGTTTYLLDIVKHLEASGHNTLVAASPGLLEDQFVKYGSKVVIVPELIDHSSFIYPIYLNILPKEFTSSYIYNGFNKSIIKRLFDKITKNNIKPNETRTSKGNSRSLTSKLFPLLKSIKVIYRELQTFKPDIAFTSQLQPTIATIISRELLRANFPIYEFAMGIKNTMDLPAPWFITRYRYDDKLLATTNEIFERLEIIRDRKNIITVGNCIDENRFFPLSEYQKEQLRINIGQQKSQFIILSVSSSSIYLPNVKATCQAFIDFYKLTNFGILLIVSPDELKHEFALFQNEIRLYSGEDKIFHLGRITNHLEQIYNLADVFVGVGRSTREAMLCGVPSIVYGIEGHPGIVNPDNIENIRFYNYSGRGCNRKPDPKNLTLEFLQIFNMKLSERVGLGCWGREYIRETESYKTFFDKVNIEIITGN